MSDSTPKSVADLLARMNAPEDVTSSPLAPHGGTDREAARGVGELQPEPEPPPPLPEAPVEAPRFVQRLSDLPDGTPVADDDGKVVAWAALHQAERLIALARERVAEALDIVQRADPGGVLARVLIAHLSALEMIQGDVERRRL
jgi:hypothetical protein